MGGEITRLLNLDALPDVHLFRNYCRLLLIEAQTLGIIALEAFGVGNRLRICFFDGRMRPQHRILLDKHRTAKEIADTPCLCSMKIPKLCFSNPFA